MVATNYQKKNNKLITQLNLIFCLYICAWIIVPVFRSMTNQGVFQLLFFLVVVMWFLTSLLLSRKWFYNLLGISLIGSVYIITMLLYYLFGYGDMKITQLVPTILLFVFVYMGYFYFSQGSSTSVNIIIKFIAFCFIITAATTAYNLLIDINVSRLITSASTSTEVIRYLESRNVAGFDFIYGTILLIPILLMGLKQSFKTKLFLPLLIIVTAAISVLALSNFTTAYLFLIIAIFLAFFTSYKNIYLVFITVASIMGILFPILLTTLIGILEYIRDITPSIMTQDKLMSVIGILEGNSDIESASIRTLLMETSINGFLSNPFIGFGAYYHDHNMIGNHSQFIDDLGRYGIIGSLPIFIFMFYSLMIIKRRLQGTKVRNSFIFCSLLFLLLGFLNPIQSYGIIFAIFLVLPLISRYLQENSTKYSSDRRVKV
ncbi:O-antigen ligase family protein [Cytobacillus sp. FSL K6-0265]|uniref:O-antigen ligase family protein n=1 Tax=Cytobacillus sp. FSL K6-0265 TaxID=2921448 RepID=UPI0030F4D8A4